MALDFPWGEVMKLPLQKQRQRNENFGQAADFGASIGGGIGDIINQYKQKKLLDQLIQQLKTQGSPQQGPPLAPQGTPQPQSMGTIPPGQPMSAGGNIGQDVQMPQPIPTQGPGQPVSGIGGPAQDNSKQIQALMMQLDPQGMIKSMLPSSPLQQSEIAKNYAMAGKYGQMGGAAKPTGTVYRNSSTGEMTDDPSVAVGPEWKSYKTTQGDVLNKLAGQTSGKAKNKAMGSRAEAMQRGIDTRQIDALVSRTGLTPKMQSQLQMNTMRALRSYIPILSRPRITYQELALGEMDLAGIMHGGVPQRDELVSTHFPGWQEKLAQIRTYAEGHPQEMVPPDIQAKVKQMIGDVVKIDNQFLQANSKFAKTMLGSTIRGGILPQQTKAIDEMTGTLTPPLGESQLGQSDPLGVLK